MNDPGPIVERQPVHVHKGTRVVIDNGHKNGVKLELTHFASGAMQLRELRSNGTRHVIRAWSPKEAKG